MVSICTFCGHSNAPDGIRPLLAATIRRCIEEHGVDEFWVGNYGAFDRMAKTEVRRAKEQFPQVGLYLLVPYLPEDSRRIDKEGVDQVLFPEEMDTVPKRQAIPRLNRYMVDRASCLISYVTHASGGAYKTMEHARSREKRGLLTIFDLSKP